VKKKNFRVPNRDIKIKPHELVFINTRCFQRLYDIKQLGLASLVYPFATHTRAAHCLDCLDMSQRFINSLMDNYQDSTLISEEMRKKTLDRISEDTDLIRSAALLHDIMHIPFAHTLEDENGILEKGDKGIRIDVMVDRIRGELENLTSSSELGSHILFGFESKEELNKIIKENKKLLDDVKKVLWTIAYPDDEAISKYVAEKAEKIKKEKKEFSEKDKKEERERIERKRLDPNRFYIADIIGNTISADLLSYILRDAEFTGIEIKPGFWYRLFDYFELRQKNGKNRLVIRLTKKGDWRQDVLSAIVGILNVRFAITEAVIYHHAKCAASAMLSKLTSLCDVNEVEELYDIGDEGYFAFLDNKIQAMEKDLTHKAEGAKRLLDSLRSRRLYKRFHLVAVSDQRGYAKRNLSEIYSRSQKRSELEETIEKEFGLRPGSIVIFCPSGKMALKEAKALVVYENIGDNGALEENIAELDDKECLATLYSRHPSSADRVKNVVAQYEALWKLYVFIDPDYIPIYGAAIKERLKETEIGKGDLIFDQSYVCSKKEYIVSRKLEEKVRDSVPKPQIPAVFREIPEIVNAPRKGESGDRLDWIESNVDDIVKKAKDLMESRGKQGKLSL